VSSEMTLRPYQADIVERVLSAVATHGSTVMQMPTAAGKTRAATEIVKRSAGTVWFICHRREIIRQTVKAFNRAGIDHGVISPEYPQEYDRPVQVASVQTLINRIDDLEDPDTVVWDECHHIGADSWSAIMRRYPHARHVGLTATPERSDGKGLNKWFKSLVLGPSIRPLINDGFLSDFRYFAPSEPDLREAKLRAGDYRPEDIDKAMNTPVVIGDAISEYRKNCDGKRALVFASSVEASETLVARFNAEGIPAAHVDGTTPTEQRDASVAALQAGEIKVLSNFAVFTEGFDLPAIDAVILMRPTKSVGLFLQMVGRGLRPAPGKDVVFIFDHAGLWLEHAQPDSDWQWSLEGNAAKAQRKRAGGLGPRRCPKCKEVRYERVEACCCGYEFPSGREVGEFDGVLYEVRGEAPEGFETRAEFARRNSRNPSLVRRWLERGMPGDIGRNIVEIEPALQWISTNCVSTRSNIDESHCGATDFAKMVGSSQSEINRLTKKGLPTNSFGHIHIETGLAWYEKHKASSIVPDGKIRVPDFAEMIGRNQSVIYSWIKRGKVSVDENYLLVLSEALDFYSSRHQPRTTPPPEGCLRRKHFGQLFGKSGSSVISWVARGLPTKGEFIPIESGSKWVRKNVKVAEAIPSDSVFEKKSAFARRLRYFDSKKRPYVSMIGHFISKGLPKSESHGWVHIQRGLEWVRDNTSITIPPEAWPVANDNGERKEEAA